MQTSAPFLTLGTRGSPLALAQAHLVQAALAALHDVAPAAIAIKVISTSGDRLKDVPLSEVGGKGLFTKEIEIALFDGAIDVGVHSGKDVETVLPYGLVLPVFLEREDVRDAFVSLRAPNLDHLFRGAKFGTSSIRRAAQMLRYRPDLTIVPFRGNVETRLRKLADGIADATLLAMAGLNRLGHPETATALLDPKNFPPAPAQGAVALQCRAEDSWTQHAIARLDHPATHIAVIAERAMLRELDGSCRTPIGALSEIVDDTLTLTGQILTPDGKQCWETTLSAPTQHAETLGAELGRALRDMAGERFLTLLDH
ncbi:MAG: porphobilinogen deaminase [Devosia sp.]|nr:porphobilinogen deaminase [Devosia sp.]